VLTHTTSIVGGGETGGATSKTQIDLEKALQLSTDAVQKGCELGCKSTSRLLEMRKERTAKLDLKVRLFALSLSLHTLSSI
jgi:hypothetical protein